MAPRNRPFVIENIHTMSFINLIHSGSRICKSIRVEKRTICAIVGPTIILNHEEEEGFLLFCRLLATSISNMSNCGPFSSPCWTIGEFICSCLLNHPPLQRIVSPQIKLLSFLFNSPELLSSPMSDGPSVCLAQRFRQTDESDDATHRHDFPPL